jgi:hypothetical protein
MKLPPPDFVVVGAAKCGTTAVYETLRQHSQLFLPEIKEPHYFAYDFPKIRSVETIGDYDRLFAGAERTQLRGEVSAHYLNSKGAIAAILRRRPDAKFIALVRNFIDMFVSCHNQMLNGLDEEEEDAERAWMLQEERAQGRRIPRLCRIQESLQYKTLCSLGTQIESLFRLVPEHQRLVIVHDDLQQAPRQAYEQIVEFLGIQDDGRDRFVRANVFARPRSELIARVIRFAILNPAVKKVGDKVKPTLHRHGMRPIGWLARQNSKYIAKPILSREFRQKLEAAFAPDVQLLSRLLRRDLCSLWSIGDGVSHTETGTQRSAYQAAVPAE